MGCNSSASADAVAPSPAPARVEHESGALLAGKDVSSPTNKTRNRRTKSSDKSPLLKPSSGPKVDSFLNGPSLGKKKFERKAWTAAAAYNRKRPSFMMARANRQMKGAALFSRVKSSDDTQARAALDIFKNQNTGKRAPLVEGGNPLDCYTATQLCTLSKEQLWLIFTLYDPKKSGYLFGKAVRRVARDVCERVVSEFYDFVQRTEKGKDTSKLEEMTTKEIRYLLPQNSNVVVDKKYNVTEEGDWSSPEDVETMAKTLIGRLGRGGRVVKEVFTTKWSKFITPLFNFLEKEE